MIERTKRHPLYVATDRYAKTLLSEHLKHDLPPEEFDQFVRFCGKTSHDLLKHTLKELRGAAKAAAKARKAGGQAQALLPRIHRVYHRKLGEQHRLFPIFELFETSYRSFLALWLETHYGTATWWDEPYQWLRKGNKSIDLLEVNSVPITLGVARAIETLLRNVDEGILTGNVVPRLGSGQEILRLSKLSDLETICKEHWPLLRNALPSRLANGSPLDAAVFEGMFRRVREARNACFHHKEVSERASMASNVELLLDLIDVHAATMVDSATCAAVRPFTYQVPHLERHAHGLSESVSYRIEVVARGREFPCDVQARSGVEALTKVLAALAPDDYEGLTTLRVLPAQDAATENKEVGLFDCADLPAC